MPQRTTHTQLEIFETGELLTELCIEGLGLDAHSVELLPLAKALLTLVRYHDQRAQVKP
jgi:hypothetical protein